MKNDNNPLNGPLFQKAGFPILFLLAALSSGFTFALKNHLFGSEGENDPVYTRMLLLSIVLAVWLIGKAILALFRRT